MPRPTVSVVIPCYNDGPHLREALTSVMVSDYRPIEVIIVNDGSTDSSTLEQLEMAAADGHTVVHQSNSGQSSARNNGISISTGSYVLTLDADNRVRPQYIGTAVRLLESDPAIGVVYGRLDQFGCGSGRGIGQPFDPQLLLFRNYIDTLAVFRKSVWESVGGYDNHLRGNEDWDFWLRALGQGVGFHFINEVMFDYRVKEVSVTTAINQSENYKKFLTYFSQKHGSLYYQGYCDVYTELMYARSNPMRYFVRQRWPELYSVLKRLMRFKLPV